MISKQFIRTLSLILIFSAHAFAQKPEATPQTEEQRKARQELEHKTLALLDDVIKESDTFKRAENRILIKAQAASLLWKYDEARARLLFKDAIALFIDLQKEQENVDAPEAGGMFNSPKLLRVMILMTLAQHDERMAIEFMRATRTSSQTNVVSGAMGDYDTQMDLNLAVQLAPTNPKLAVEIAEDSLQKGFPYQLSSIISAIREKDPEAASRLASDILVKLRAEKLESNSEASQIAVILLLTATATPGGDAKKSAENIRPLLDQPALYELTNMVAAEALRSTGRNDSTSEWLHDAMPVIEKYAPARAEQLRHKVAQQKKSEADEEDDSEEGGNYWAQYSSLIQKGSADDLLAAAPKAQPPARDMLYQSAVAKLMEKGDTDRARQITTENIKDATMRKTMLEQLDKTAAVAAAEQGKIEQARKVLSTLRTNEERVVMLAQLATSAAAKGDKKLALKFLEEANGMISEHAKNAKELGAQFMVAHAYAEIDPARSFEILEPIVDQLSELLNAAILVSGFYTEGVVRDDELMLGSMWMLLGPISAQFTQYFSDMGALARADFERTKGLVDKFQRYEIRVMMRLLLAQNILAPQSKGVTNNGRMFGPLMSAPRDID